MQLQCGRFQLDLSRPQIMGIVNLTPDSFSDGGHYAHADAAILHAQQLIAEGADIVDLGAESTRPGALEISAEQELARLLPVLHALKNCGKPISIDTYKPAVMRAALQAGADMINDVNALQAEGAVQAVAASECALCIMHRQGQPRTMQAAPRYANVVDEVLAFLTARATELTNPLASPTRINSNRIVLDPGFGFGKTLEHNLALLHHFKRFVDTGYATLAGLSRKSMIGTLTAQAEPQQRLIGSVAAALYAVQQGAQIVRVHDVAATRQALNVWQAAQAAA